MKVEIYQDETLDDLQYKGLKLIQKKDGFRFGMDAVLLANFADVGDDASVLDIGSGTGIIPILIAGKTKARTITGLEIQPDMVEMSLRSVEMNELGERINIINGDIRCWSEYFKPSSFDVVVSNPPYMNWGGGIVNPLDSKAVARHEILCTLEDVIGAAARLLIPGGQFAMVHRPERLVDVIWLMRKYNIEPKYLRFVHPSFRKKPNLVLIKGNRGGKPYLKIMDPLYVYDQNGQYTDEIKRIYGKGENGVE